MPQNSIKNCFLVVSDYCFYKNWPLDLVRGLFSNLDIGTYIQFTCEPLCTFFGPIGGAQMPQNSINIHFLGVLDHFSYKNRPIDLVRCPFSNLDTGTYIQPTCRSVFTFLGPFGEAQMPQNRRKKTKYWLFPTISFTRMGLFIWLGAYFQASTLEHTSHPLAPFLGPFRGAQMPQNSTKNLFFGWSGPFILQECA
jgi:hypothetical protein